MTPVAPFECRLDDPGADAAFRAFVEALCGESASRRYAILAHHAGTGPRCLLESSGRCLPADTPWRMARAMVEPLLRFDDTVEWVALFPIDDWKARGDRAMADAMAAGESWTRRLSRELADELPRVPRLIVRR
ncbi:MAG: hypothetical protein ACM33T_03115 [Solirubrobacterales bacterium]